MTRCTALATVPLAPLALLSGCMAVAEPVPTQTTPTAVIRDGSLARCESAGYEGPVLCGTVEVLEDPSERAGRVLGLNVLVLEATGPDSVRAPDPIFVLDGGPGQAATRAIGWVSRELSVALRRRDVVLVDRRGTGGSNALDCPEPDPSLPLAVRMGQDPVEAARRCRKALEGRAELTKYTSPFAADDLDAVREALGYERINLYGGSYGSREAFVYMRRHRERLRSGAVFAVTPQHERALLQSPATAETAVQRLIDDCMADDACRTAYPDLRRELREVVRRLEVEPGRFTAPAPGAPTGNPPEELELTRERFGALVRTLLISPAGGAQVPYLIHLAYRREYEPLGALYVRLTQGMSGAIARGLFLSVVCAEDMGRTAPSEIGAAAGGTFWGPAWPRSIAAQCAEWPLGDLPDDWATPPSGDTPFILLAGRLDPIAAPVWAEELTHRMPNARRVLVQEGHHNFPLDDCGQRTLARFYDTTNPFDLDTACIASVPRPPFLVPGSAP